MINQRHSGYSGTTTTTTTTTQPPITIHLTQGVPSSTLEKVNAFVNTLEISPHLSTELKSRLNQWKIDYLADFEKLSDEEEKVMATQDLSFLYNDVIFAAMPPLDVDEKSQDNDSDAALKLYEEQLAALVPEGLEDLYAEMVFADQGTSFLLQGINEIDHSLLEERMDLINKGNLLLQGYHQHHLNMQTSSIQQVESYQNLASDFLGQQASILGDIKAATQHLTTLNIQGLELSSTVKEENTKLDGLLDETAALLNKGIKK